MKVTIMYRGAIYDHVAVVNIADTCPICGQKRGETYHGRAYDGSRPYAVDNWDNPCGHTDYYCNVYHEAITNGLNRDRYWDFDNLKGFKITKENEKAILSDIQHKCKNVTNDEYQRKLLMEEIRYFILYFNPNSQLVVTCLGDIVDKNGEIEAFMQKFFKD